MVEVEAEVVATAAFPPDTVVDPPPLDGAAVDAALPFSDKGLELTSELAPDAFDIVADIEFVAPPAVLFSSKTDFSECLIIVQWSLTFSGSWGLITKLRRFSGSGMQH